MTIKQSQIKLRIRRLKEKRINPKIKKLSDLLEEEERVDFTYIETLLKKTEL